MHVFCDVPLASVYIVAPLVAEMLGRFEVHHIAAILLPHEDMGQRGFVPLITVILVQRPVFTRPPPALFHVESGRWDLLVFQIYSDLVPVLPVQKQAENKADNFRGFFVNYPKIFVVRVFHITVWGFGSDKAHVVPSEYLHRVSDLEIIASPACQVFHNADAYLSAFHVLHHAGVGGAVKKTAADSRSVKPKEAENPS